MLVSFASKKPEILAMFFQDLSELFPEGRLAFNCISMLLFEAIGKWLADRYLYTQGFVYGVILSYVQN